MTTSLLELLIAAKNTIIVLHIFCHESSDLFCPSFFPGRLFVSKPPKFRGGGLECSSQFNPIPYGGGCFSPPQTDIANCGVLCIENMLFYHLTFHITGLPNFWQKNNLNLLFGSLKNLKISEFSKLTPHDLI